MPVTQVPNTRPWRSTPSQPSTVRTPHDVVRSIAEMVRDEATPFEFGSFSGSAYDTAWVSMVAKHVDDKESEWLFPEAFQVVLDGQLENGTWPSYASPVDGILNTLASLLSLLVHDRATASEDLRFRISNANEGLRDLLQGWSVADAVHVGFEVLVPSLLHRIAEFGIHIEFPGRKLLLELHAKKLATFNPEMAYMVQPTTLLHSLEALVGMIDFDRVGHHCSETLGIFGSPAATAAYLINCSTWDVRAESYLRKVTERLEGSVPSAYPTPVFEFSWALSTILSNNLDHLVDLSPGTIEALAAWYQNLLSNQNGIVGFAPGILADADDTARALLTAHYLGLEVSCDSLISTFKSPSCFRTYQLDGKPSLSANCNVCLALLVTQKTDAEDHTILIRSIFEFLQSLWGSGQMSDKWNLSHHYSSMLLLEVLVTLLQKTDQGSFPGLSEDVLYRDAQIMVCQILSTLMKGQAADGSWNESIEETAFCMIAITKSLVLPWGDQLRAEIQEARRKAHAFISNCPDTGAAQEYLWVEKVTYGSALLHRTYVSTALNTTVEKHEWTGRMCDSFEASRMYSRGIRPMFSKLPLFRGEPFRYVDLALVEATHYAKRLKQHRTMIFPRDELPMTKDEYLAFIPVIWTICNQKRTHPLSPDVLWDMIVLSMLNYQIDEYMETVVGALPPANLPDLLSHIQESCESRSLGSMSSEVNGRNPPDIKGGRKDSVASDELVLARTAKVLDAYTGHVLKHVCVTDISDNRRNDLAVSLRAFITSHIVQNLNSRPQQPGKADTAALSVMIPRQNDSFFQWVRTTAAESTSCPFSFQFFLALLSHQGVSIGENTQILYWTKALAGHLATMCRMYNDCGSVSRDATEGNLNSLDFPDFRVAGAESQEIEIQKRKRDLLELAQFERECMEAALRRLKDSIHEAVTNDAIDVFVDVTDLFGQIYVQRDIASRVKASV